MPLDPLATPEQLAARMTNVSAPAERVNAALVDASAAVRAYTGQQFNLMVTMDVLKAACAGVIRLPQRPVIDVDEVAVHTLAGLVPVPFLWAGADRLEVTTPAVRFNVTYEHGYEEGAYPDDVVAVVCNVAARTLGHPREDSGVTQQSITNYSESFGVTGAAGPVGLFDDEKAALMHYRRVGVSTKVCFR
jgi:hypothetical protein